ncbi:hypothetical protein [Porphyromonas gingivicanis]|uniref:hypothetical protein n=1 Tax=Porphyromonas gingivicanis TaxID=266762 RepID=UPI003F9D0ABE
MVRLVVQVHVLESVQEHCFNSIMVRLVVTHIVEQLMYCIKFQFHNGAISRQYRRLVVYTDPSVSIP